MARNYKQDSITPHLDEIKDLPLNEMVRFSKEKVKEASDRIRELKYMGESDELSQVLKYYHDLKSLLYFLENKERSQTTQPKRFDRFKWIAHKLVKKGDLEESVLEQFDWT